MLINRFSNAHSIKIRKKVKSKRRKNKLAMLKSKELKVQRRKKRRNKKKRAFNFRYINHDFLKFIKKTPFRSKVKLSKTSKQHALIKIPEVFSLIENPDETLDVYNKIFSVFNKKDLKGIYFDHSKCEKIEIGASTVMDVFVMNLEQHMKNQGRNFTFGGELPSEDKNKVILMVSGILKHLNVGIPEDEILEKFPGEIIRLKLLSGGRNTSTYKVHTPTKSDIVATQVAEYFADCLKTQGLGITKEGKSYIGQMVGETINNCQLHSGDFSQWFTLGHYYIEDGSNYGECQLVIYNFGQTIYEGLKNNAIDPQTVKNLEEITSLHTASGFFNTPHWDEEVLWTLYALQDGVSRAKSIDDPDRGTGTVTLIEAFQNIGSTIDGKKAEMSIISGMSFIYFDGKYKLERKDNGEDFRDIIAFNKNNELNEVPDKRYVKKLRNYFPGTIISLDFFIDRQYIINLKEKDENGNQFE